VLDATIYPELQAEGWARDFVRIIQAARKQADLKVTPASRPIRVSA
jgi:isoleucyl-tRNA synthetase